MLGLEMSTEIIVIGALSGLAYAVLAAGLVLVYRATKVINFAHGEIGAFGAAILAKLVLDLGWNWVLSFVLVLVIGGALGALIELTVIRRLFNASRLVILVATIGVAQLLFFAQAVLPGIDKAAPYPTGFHRTMQIGGLLLQGQHFVAIAFVPAAMMGLAYLLNRSPYGVAIRAAASNRDSTRLAGISTRRISTLVWVLAGVLATGAVVISNPIRGVLVGGSFAAGSSVGLGPSLLLRALAAALAGRLTSLPITLAAAVGIGVTEAVLLVNVSSPRLMDFVLFVVILVLVLVLARRVPSEDDAPWSVAAGSRPVSPRLTEIAWVRLLPHFAAGATLALAVVLPLFFTSSARVFLFTRVLLFAMIALSVLVVLGWAGQLSLCQFAFVGLGSVVLAALQQRGMPFGPAVVYATVAGVLAALVIGLPALRVRGLFLAVATLAFAISAGGYILSHEFFFGDTTVVTVRRGELWGIDLNAHRTYYYLCLLVLVGTVGIVSSVRRTGVGRRIIAVRDNERSAASYAVSPRLAKLTAFALSGGLAALAGALLGGLRVQVSSQGFGPELSLEAVAMTIIGGLGSITGALLGAAYMVGLPSLFDNSPEVRLLTSGVGLLFLLMYVPGGLIQILHAARDAGLGIIERRLEPAAAAPDAPTTAGPVALAVHPVKRGDDDGTSAALEVDAVSVTFGGVTALDDVSIRANRGEVIGLIGANGAGKSTLMNAISGFLEPNSGQIRIYGRDITALPPHLRARSGLGRVFQDARLFESLTVKETVCVALESHFPSQLVPSMLALPPSRCDERAKATEADELIGFLGLGRYVDTQIEHLSTGTRRIVELACLLALGPSVLLLDEPTAGVAQRETEAFGPLIKRVQTELAATVVIIEHDIPLVTSLSDRLYCLATGRLIAEGEPDAVRTMPAVISSYLGTDERAIKRSDLVTPGSRPTR